VNDAATHAASPSPLPRLLLLTDRRACEAKGRTLADTVAAAVEAGVRCVVFREKDLATRERAQLAGDVATAAQTATLIVASDPVIADVIGSEWLHLAAAEAVPASRFRWGRSCHSREDVGLATHQGAAYATLSPVFMTASKPGYGPALGTKALACVCQSTSLPVYGLGGIGALEAAGVLAAGAAGIAVMGAVMGADDPGIAARHLVNAVNTFGAA
jgi:thiamine-phosphate pyrophosphorylase